MTDNDKQPFIARVTQGYRSLKWRIVAVLLAAAMLPLLLAGFGSWEVFGDLLEQKSSELLRRSVQHNADAIESHLAGRRQLLQSIATNHSLAELKKTDRLQELFANLNEITDNGFVDLGVIDQTGDHLAYVGPYDLKTRNYRDADWFREVLARGHYVSDMFLGYRQVPHCVIAVRASKDGRTWVIRATVNSAQFDEMVKAQFQADSSEVFIVNRSGRYQTTPPGGQLLDSSSLEDLTVFPGLQDTRVKTDGHEFIRVMTWINDNRWLLVVQQDVATVRAPVDQAIARGAYVVLAAFVILILTTVLATWHLTRQIDRVTAEREEISRAFVRSAKLASIGELTTGLAHEINNPLAIISAEQTNINDILSDPNSGKEDLEQAMESVRRCLNQVRRCGAITQKLLQFGRSKESHVEPTELAPRLKEIKGLMERQAGLRNIGIELYLEEGLPPVMADQIEIEQVIVNLINNAFDAMPNGGTITIRAALDIDRVLIEVADTGTGIPPEDLDRVLEPFYTTKPVGKGTGLGLSVCYGIVRSWGGEIEISSEMGVGTAVRLILAYQKQD
ncbi:MAG TPA: ATP-binding protein [candidate division Zixibacteria bacterium]|nr:ATP-binding protein [candidate division Zixibacteria bacterium]